MWKNNYSRREFIKKNSLTGLGAVIALNATTSVLYNCANGASDPAILGGIPVRTEPWLSWPVWDMEKDEEQVMEILRSGRWWRGAGRPSVVDEFEKEWAETLGVKRSLAVVNGTNSLIISLRMLNVGAGDEVIVTPYTFIATTHAILETGAMPVFADVDRETFQIDPEKIEEKITSRTRAILPVHILGLPADMVKIMEIARENDLVVVEDACQAWMAEINNQKLGTFGNAGCFSFQNSKNLPIGEGGAIVSNDDDLMDKCHAYHNTGRPVGRMVDLIGGNLALMGNNLRMTEYQAAIGLAQLKRLEQQTETRNRNAAYLKSKISGIPGIIPYKLYPNVTRAAFHLFPFRYQQEEFNDLPKEAFLQALRAEGIPASGGYTGLNDKLYLKDAFQSKNYQAMYPKEMLDFEKYLEENKCPENDRLCSEEAVWFSQNMLLGSTSDMDDIYDAIEKIHTNSGRIKDSRNT